MHYHYAFTASGFTNDPAKGDRAGHARLLQRVPQSADRTRWSVKDESIAVDGSGQETTTIDYSIQTKDDAGKMISDTFAIMITNPLPSKERSRNEWLKQQIGTEKAALFSWTFTLPGLPPSGTADDATLTCDGERTIIRIERELKDPAGSYQHPSREDPTRYGAYKPM